MGFIGSAVQRDALRYLGSAPRSPHCWSRMFSVVAPAVVRDLPCSLHMCPPCPPSDSKILTRQLAGICRGKSEAWVRAKYSDPCREQTYDLGLLSTVFLLTPLTEHPESPSFSQVHMHHGNTQRLPGHGRNIQTKLGFLVSCCFHFPSRPIWGPPFW